MAAKRGDKQNGKGPTIVIRREEVVEGGHHGGAWKVAYADFVTAMMAFFLLMWLLNATTEEQRKGLADYFSPNNIMSQSSSGTGQPFGGNSATVHGSLASDRGAVEITHGKAPAVDADEEDVPQAAQPAPSRVRSKDPDADAVPARSETAVSGAANGGQTASEGRTGNHLGTIHAVLAPAPNGSAQGEQLAGAQSAGTQAAGTQSGAAQPSVDPRAPTPAELRAEHARAEKARFEMAAEQLREAVRSDPALAGIASQLAIDLTPEGLRIQILDEEQSPMFTTGSAVPNDRARLLLQKVAPVLARLPEEISLAGHTDAAPYHGGERSNWELSTERANATRRLLVEAGLPESRVRNVTGNADRDPLLPGDPLAAANRRIAIVVLRGTQARITQAPVTQAPVTQAPQR